MEREALVRVTLFFTSMPFRTPLPAYLNEAHFGCIVVDSDNN